MNLHSVFRRAPARIVVFGLLVFVLLTIRFSPNWVTFYFGLRDAKVNVSNPAQSAAIDKAILSGHSARGLYVTKQARDLNAEIDDPNHKIVRWRLLVPVLGHLLKLPSWLILSLAHVGCIVLILAFVAIGFRHSTASSRPSCEPIYLGVIAGASAPFFTSMGLLGYYDSWLALALIGVAFARHRWAVFLACFLAPWIDERFVIGLPLALCVRRILADGPAESRWAWFKNQALIPIILVAGYSMVRLKIGGSGGSQTVGDYLNQFVFPQKLTVTQRLFGAWAGLRISWLLVAAAIIGSWKHYAPGNQLEALLLATGVALTGLIGLFTALDLSRSMVLIIPVVPLGWIIATRTAWWSKYYAAPVLAATAVLLPASHVVGTLSRPVDNLWSPPMPLMTAQNNLGMMYVNGDGVPKDSSEAVKWFRMAVEQDFADAQNNLGWMYLEGDGVPKDSAEAVKWFRKAVEQGNADAQKNLGLMYANGDGVPKDNSEAVKWFRMAAEQGNAGAQCNLGVMFVMGEGAPKNSAAAMKWFRLAAEQDNAKAQCNLGVMYAQGDGVPKDNSEAVKWFRKAAELGHVEAQSILGVRYFTGDGMPKDSSEAVKWFRKAAEQGNANAQCNLGVLYAQGDGVPKDNSEAAKWYRKAAEQGNADAQGNLGVMYAQGDGVPKDLVQAHYWLMTASAMGNETSKKNLVVIEKTMSPEQIAEATKQTREFHEKQPKK